MFKKKSGDPPMPTKMRYPRDGEQIASSTTLPVDHPNVTDGPVRNRQPQHGYITDLSKPAQEE